MSEFVPIAQAARALGVDARQVRRWVDRLEPKDKGQPIVTVRLSAVEALKNGTFLLQEPKDTSKGQNIGQSKDRTVRDVSDEVSLDLREIITRQDAEIARLAEALATSQRLTDQAQQLQLMTERRAAALEAEVQQQAEVQQLKAIPAMESTTAPMSTETAQGAQDGPIQGDSGPVGQAEPPIMGTAQNGQKRGFWRRLFSGGG